MSLARGAAIGALCAVAVVLAIVIFGGDDSHKYRLVFQTAGQLVKGDDVQVGGRRIGSVDAIILTKDNRAAVDISVEDGIAPLHIGTTATVRLTSLSGVANRYIQLDLAPNSAPKLPDGATIGQDRTTSVVDLDQVFDTLDPPTREGLGRFIRGQAAWYKGKEPETNLSAYYFNPALSTTSEVFSQLGGDQQALGQAVTASAGAVGAIAARSDNLTSLVSNANATAGAIASENQSFSEALAILPATLRRGSSTFVDVRTALGSLQQLVDVSKPNTVRLTEFFSALRPVVSNAVPDFQSLATIIRKPGANNDLTEAFRSAPALQKAANGSDTAAFPSTIDALQKGTPVLTFARPYSVDLTGWIRDFGQLTSFYDANGHYARVSPVFNAYKSDMTLLPADQRQSIYTTLPSGSSNYNRCPGSASQIPSNSAWSNPASAAPWPFKSGGASGCDPSQVPPGP
ncbi:MAG: MlaD family protein [Solirubrobacterales bacterium]|nr:MlaD family protein [Solirubrobacterales bacterium]